MGTRGGRAEKVRKIFERFDENRDGGLNREEMAALVVAVNPRVKFSGDQINAILDEVFRTYADFIDPAGAGLSLTGLIRTYDDGAGDVDRDFDALSLSLSLSLPSSEASSSAAAAAAAVDDGAGVSNPPPPATPCADQEGKQLRSAAAADVAFDETWKLLDDLDILLKRLRAKQLRDGKIKAGAADFDAFSDTAGWSRELGPPSGEWNVAARPASWASESGADYRHFVQEVGQLRQRADRHPSRMGAFDGHMAVARALADHHLFALALAGFRRATELQPFAAKAYFRCGNALFALGRAAEAKEQFLQAKEVAESDAETAAAAPHILPQIHINLGICYEAEGLVLAACEHYREAAILSPAHFRALKLLGGALLGVGEYRAAEKALEEAIFLKPDYADAHCDLGSALHALGDDERAVQEFQKAIDLRPGHVDALYNLGGLYMDMGRYQRASEMYARVLAVSPAHWRAQLNKAVALLGAGEVDDARRTLKEAFKMTNRAELYDAIVHLKAVHHKKKPKSGDDAAGAGYFVVETTRFKRVGRRTTVRQDLSSALEIRAFQRATRLYRVDAEQVRKLLGESDVPVSYSGDGQPRKSIRKAALEAILRKLLHFLKPDTFQGSMKAMNERVLSVMDAAGAGRVDMGLFFAILAPLCAGAADRRKRVTFDALLWRPPNDDAAAAQIKKSDAIAYIKLLRAVYVPSQGVSDMMELHGEAVDQSMVSFPEFVEMFDEQDWGFGIISTVVKLEVGDRTRHGGRSCAICRYPIIGSRFKEMKCRFSLCNRCYSEGKVPTSFKREEYTFKEYGSEAQVMRDKFSCFGAQSKHSNTDP